jgi:hypothetical protein
LAFESQCIPKLTEHPQGGGTAASCCIWTACWKALWDYGILLKLGGFGLGFGLVVKGLIGGRQVSCLAIRESLLLTRRIVKESLSPA